MVGNSRGLSFLEAIVALAVFSAVVLVLTSLQAEYTKYDREMNDESLDAQGANLVIARLRRDVIESSTYPASFGVYEQSDSTLILESTTSSGLSRRVVWDFREPSVARRKEFSGTHETEWRTRGVPQFRIGSVTMADGAVAVRITATDEGGRLRADRVVTPRAD